MPLHQFLPIPRHSPSGRIVREAKVASEPAALIAWFREIGLGMAQIGLEAGPLSQ
jgi:transposase